jgi:hypothetical protein
LCVGSTSGFNVLIDSEQSIFDWFGWPGITNSGEVVFYGRLDDDSYVTSRWANGSVTTILQHNAQWPGGESAINEAGDAVYRTEINGQPTLVLIHDKQPQAIVSVVHGFLDVDAPVIIDSGAVFFAGRTFDGVWGMHTYNNGVIAPLIVSSVGFSLFPEDIRAVDANESHVLYRAATPQGIGLYVDGERIIGVGDALDGSTVSAVHFSRGALNDSGQIAFYAQFTNSRRCIYRAEPACAGDYNHSGTVDVDDLLFVISQWGGGGMNINDLLAVIENWGPCGQR